MLSSIDTRLHIKNIVRSTLHFPISEQKDGVQYRHCRSGKKLHKTTEPRRENRFCSEHIIGTL